MLFRSCRRFKRLLDQQRKNNGDLQQEVTELKEQEKRTKEELKQKEEECQKKDRDLEDQRQKIRVEKRWNRISKCLEMLRTRALTSLEGFSMYTHYRHVSAMMPSLRGEPLTLRECPVYNDGFVAGFWGRGEFCSHLQI